MLNNQKSDTNEMEHDNTQKLLVNDKTALNNLCGGTSNLIDFMQNSINHSNHQLNDQATSLQNTNNLYHCEKSIYENTEKLSGFEYEFHQLCKKIDRVKENFTTHKKFMDIVKL